MPTRSRDSIVALPALGLVAALAWPTQARAGDAHWVSPGLSLGISLGDRPTFSVALDVRYSYLPQGNGCGVSSAWGMGTFGQAALLVNGGGVAGRFAVGAHGGSSFGFPALQPSAEAGWTYRTAYKATDTHPASPGWHGLHLGLTTWFYVLEELTVRSAIPLSAPPEANTEVTLGVGPRLPPYGFAAFCVEGRPLRIDDAVVLPPVVYGAPCAADDPEIAKLDGATRAALAEAWLVDARTECASIPVFEALARDLAFVGAPDDLVARALASADDESAHTLLCSAMASRFSGRAVAPALFATPPMLDTSRETALVRLAVEAYRDGCVGEGAAAERARRALATTHDPLAHELHARVAVDEQRHADLAWDILAFCLSEGGAPVRRAVLAAMDAASPAPEDALPDPLVDVGAWRAHGRLDRGVILDAFDARRAAARSRIGRGASG